MWKKQFFVGVPSPAGGILCLLPLIVTFQLDHGFKIPAGLIIFHMVVVGTLMASRIPTFSGKQIKIKHEQIPQFMIACSFLLVLFIIEPWLFIVGLSTVYLLSIIFSVKRWQTLSKKIS